ncbi:RNA helicase [Plasmodiophora brassicae]|uniref:RNA helicase n=1 Tax=Plasmodiophora brassicae TaxID=37360 RepID=A0A0G4IP28_PLABS|nr:hypothetical protein PBRA_005610 [Plasmodiophora brassicae]SPR00985.1 unnamed protein product [Plasmodiophora brassicae]
MSSVSLPITGQKRAPISLDEIARKKREQEEADAKPVFVSKQERQRLAAEAALARLSAKRQAEAEARQQTNGRVPDRAVSASAPPPLPSATTLSAAEIAAEEARSKEMALIKSSYLGKKEKKKKRRATGASRSKFMFEWDTGEDTSADLNPLYNRRHDVALGFGRGYIAGIDREQQRSQSHRLYEQIDEKRREFLDKVKDAEKVAARNEKDRLKAEKRVAASRHWSDKTLEEMDARDWRIFNEDFNIAVRGTNLPHPLRSWDEAGFPAAIATALADVGYTQPTPIQRAAIPIGLIGRDLMGIAETGSGKTCAFILPMLQYILKRPKYDADRAQDGPYAVILAPTRELAQQIDDECRKFTTRLRLQTICIVGGASIQDQSEAIRRGAEILIGTPGRLNDHLRKRYLVLNQCNYIVLDEADRMIDMGFEDQVNAIMDAMPSSNLRPEDETLAVQDQVYRQTFMFSATMPAEVERMAKTYLRSPAYIAIGDRQGKAAATIEQHVEVVTDQAKKGRLMKLLEQSDPPIIVFMNQRTACDAMAKTLSQAGYRVTVMHGGKVQDQREASLDGFKSGRYDVLVATDVAGRGIDVEGVTHVINYDAPKNTEIYLHRVGRTGRAGKQGRATTFLTSSDADLFPGLRKILVDSGARVPHELAQADRDLQRMITKL